MRSEGETQGQKGEQSGWQKGKGSGLKGKGSGLMRKGVKRSRQFEGVGQGVDHIWQLSPWADVLPFSSMWLFGAEASVDKCELTVVS